MPSRYSQSLYRCALAVAILAAPGWTATAWGQSAGSSPPVPGPSIGPRLIADPRVRRILKEGASETEITSGIAANLLMPVLLQLEGPEVAVPARILKIINLAPGPAHLNADMTGYGRPTGSLGTLANLSSLSWPLHLQGPQQKALAKLLGELVQAVSDGNLDFAGLKKARDRVNDLRELNRKLLWSKEIAGSEWVEGNRFTDNLESSLHQLRQPHAAAFLKSAHTPKAKHVRELVEYLSQKSLCFAPASPTADSKEAYQILHDAMCRYLMDGPTDVLTLLAPPPEPAPAKKAPNLIKNTTWSGSETLEGYGALTFKFGPAGQAIMIDTRATVSGFYMQNGPNVTINFPGVANYFGTINGNTISGQGRSGNRAWTWTVEYEGK